MSFNNEKPNYSGKREFKKRNHFDLKNGDLVARILPAFASLQDNPEGWHSYHVVHFGYKNMEGKHRMFDSPEVSEYDKETKTRAIIVRDAAMDRVNDLKAKLEAAESSGNTAMAEKLKKLVGFMGTYNVDKNHHMNVMLLDGTAGELKIRHKAFLALKDEMRKLDAEGINPLSLDNGRFFVFSRSGKGNETNFKVSVYKQKVEAIVNGKSKLVEEDAVSSLDSKDLARLETELFDLDTLFQKPTAEEVARIVEASDLLTGKSPACDEIFDARWKANSEARAVSRAGSSSSPAKAVAAISDVAAPKVIAPLAAPTSGLDRLVEERIASKVITPVAAKPSTPSIDEMSDEEFFRTLG